MNSTAVSTPAPRLLGLRFLPVSVVVIKAFDALSSARILLGDMTEIRFRQPCRFSASPLAGSGTQEQQGLTALVSIPSLIGVFDVIAFAIGVAIHGSDSWLPIRGF